MGQTVHEGKEMPRRNHSVAEVEGYSYARQIRMLNTRATTVKGGRTPGEETTLGLRILV